MMNQIKPMIVVASLLISGIAQAQDWSCDNGDKVQLESYSTYIVINNKYRAHLQGDCNAAQGAVAKVERFMRIMVIPTHCSRMVLRTICQ